MTKHLQEIRKIAYYELCIINLIEAIDNIEDLREIKNYLRDVIKNADKIVDLYKQIDKGSDKE